MVEQGWEVAQSFDNGAGGFGKDMAGVKQYGDQAGAFGPNDIGVIIVADVKGGLGSGVCAAEGVFKNGGVRFVSVDFSRSQDQVKVMGNAEGFEFFVAGTRAVGDEAKGIAAGAQSCEGGVGVGGQGVGGGVLLSHEGVHLGSEGLRQRFRAAVGEEITVGEVLPEFGGKTAVLAQVLFDGLVDVGPISVCPALGLVPLSGEVGRAKLDGKVEEGFVRGWVIVAEGTVEVEEEGLDVVFKRGK